MTSEQFNVFWSANYPATIPLTYYFRCNYQDRWFRIHSLPDSKRYAENDEDWSILLTRQNNIIKDLLNDSSKLYAVIGEYDFDGSNETPIFLGNAMFADLKFNRLDIIDLHKISPDEYENGTTYRPYITELNWKENKYDHILKSIANYESSLFFISIDKKCLIAPYDGGVDFVLETNNIKNTYKTKYKDWLSNREDGL